MVSNAVIEGNSPCIRHTSKRPGGMLKCHGRYIVPKFRWSDTGIFSGRTARIHRRLWQIGRSKTCFLNWRRVNSFKLANIGR